MNFSKPVSLGSFILSFSSPLPVEDFAISKLYQDTSRFKQVDIDSICYTFDYLSEKNARTLLLTDSIRTVYFLGRKDLGRSNQVRFFLFWKPDHAYVLAYSTHNDVLRSIATISYRHVDMYTTSWNAAVLDGSIRVHGSGGVHTLVAEEAMHELSKREQRAYRYGYCCLLKYTRSGRIIVR